MVGLPRMYVRQLSYLGLFTVMSIILILIANKQNVIYLDDYLPVNFTPSFFQPASDIYIVDISIGNCMKLGGKSEKCGVPDDNYGALGNLYQSGGWVKIDKDLMMDNSWVKRKFFSYKKVKNEALRGRIQKPESELASEEKSKRAAIKNSKSDNGDHRVLVDIAISNPLKDSKFEGNEKLQIPEAVLKDFHSNRVFNDNDHESLVAAQAMKQKGEKTEALTVDKDKSASKKINELNIKLEQEQKEEEKSKNIKESQEKADKANTPPQKQEGDVSADFEEEVSKNVPPKNEEVVEYKEAEGAENDSGKANDKKEKRKMESSRFDLDILYTIPTKEQLNEKGWYYKSNGIWVKYGLSSNKNAITGFDILFGDDCVEPRPNWKLIKTPILDIGGVSGLEAYVTVRKGPRIDYKKKEYQPTLKINPDGKFKILQVADLHFSTGVGKCLDPVPAESKKGCKADPRTLEFLEKVLDIEKPDLVVLTGDQIFGQASPDAETSIFKALNPFIKRKIPFAVTLGNHDDEGSLIRAEVMSLSSNLPFSFASLGPEEVAGVGNYVLTVQGPKSKNPALSLYFLDSHSYSQNPKVTPGYDWLKESQLKWLEQLHNSLKKDISSYSHIHLSMGFFHIPLPEFRKLDQPSIGEQREGITAPRYNTGARSIFGRIGVSVISTGHDHCNDYCLQDVENKDSSNENKMWLCYGGGSGLGGYGGYGGYIRRMRTFEIDTNNGDIKSWKRAENEPENDFDQQILVSGGNVVNF